MAANQTMPQSALPMFRAFVPERLRMWIVLLFPIIFQCSDCVYMSLAAQMAGELNLIEEDVMMCGYTTILGVTMTFPLLFPLKTYGTTRRNLLCVTCGMVLCNLLTLLTDALPVLLVTCFLFGVMKLWGTFECMSSVMRIITPKMDFAPFLTVVFVIVFGSIQWAGFMSAQIAYYRSWEYMNLLAIGCELFGALLVWVTMCDVRLMPKGSLKGLDWIGMVLWSIFLIAVTFIPVYGARYDWLAGEEIRCAIGVALLDLGCAIGRMMRHPRPYLEYKAMSYPNMWKLLTIFGLVLILLSSEKVLLNILTRGILRYDALPLSYLNLWTLGGILIGGIFGWLGITRLGWSFRQLALASVVMLTLYAAALYFQTAPNTPIEHLYLPHFLCGAADVVLFIALTTYMELVVPFQHRFQVLCIWGFVRTGVASPIGGALYKHLFEGTMNDHLTDLGSRLDLDGGAATQLAGEVAQQAMLVSVRDLYGVTVTACILLLTLLLIARYRHLLQREAREIQN